ncbi:glycosyltransferase family 2 protein [Polynucleobacter sp. es-MAR-4]|uniref:glycosyltransferase family 2 protein n=1 Tax=Polynucleobacter sp. es-MAR-4 TaxID=1855655 RepID=UPI001C0E19D9|nr:glycosyltransferase family 2 protein [Polynucleobacter sp. es-MAR-4]MBU3637575.1 glycosyltransferase family 2 protein [Polynucleobacter sp. es-MAR-4]
MNKKYTILMPCLNEALTLGKCIEAANIGILSSGIDAEILIADNGSTDGSQKIAVDLGARVIKVPERGYGSALYFGCLSAKGDLIIMADSDQSYDFSRLEKFVDSFNQGYDFVIGNRFLGGISAGAMPWKNRYIGNPALTLIGKILFKVPINDFHCGMRAIKKSAFNRLDLRTTGMEFATEMVIKAKLAGLRMTEIPVTLDKDGRDRAPHLRPWRDGWRHLRFMFLFCPRWLFIIPGAVMFLTGFFCYVLILFRGNVDLTHSIKLGIHTLFYMQTLFLMGYLTLLFGFIVRVFAAREGILPNKTLLNKIQKKSILETGGLFSIALIFTGIYIGIIAVKSWAHSLFGELTSYELLSLVSLSTSFITGGFITLLGSLLLGFLSHPMTRNSSGGD